MSLKVRSKGLKINLFSALTVPAENLDSCIRNQIYATATEGETKTGAYITTQGLQRVASNFTQALLFITSKKKLVRYSNELIS